MSRAYSYSHSRADSPTFPSLHLITAHSPTLPSLYLRHNSFSIPSVASPTSQLILQTFRPFTYVTTHSPTLPSFIYITAHSPTLLSLLLRHRLITYVTWRAVHALLLHELVNYSDFSSCQVENSLVNVVITVFRSSVLELVVIF